MTLGPAGGGMAQAARASVPASARSLHCGAIIILPNAPNSRAESDAMRPPGHVRVIADFPPFPGRVLRDSTSLGGARSQTCKTTPCIKNLPFDFNGAALSIWTG